MLRERDPVSIWYKRGEGLMFCNWSSTGVFRHLDIPMLEHEGAEH